MRQYNSIEQLVLDDNTWREAAFNITKDTELADEILHVFYMKAITLFTRNPDKSINKNYVLTGLSNAFKDNHNHTKKNLSYTNQHHQEIEVYDAFTDIHNQILADEILKDTDELRWFDKKLFQIIIYEKKISMRALARATGISYSTIQISVAKSKAYLKNKHT